MDIRYVRGACWRTLFRGDRQRKVSRTRKERHFNCLGSVTITSALSLDMNNVAIVLLVLEAEEEC